MLELTSHGVSAQAASKNLQILGCVNVFAVVGATGAKKGPCRTTGTSRGDMGLAGRECPQQTPMGPNCPQWGLRV